MLLQDKVAIVTGGERGIGKCIAMAFKAQGSRVAIFGLNEELGDATVQELGAPARFYRCDVSHTEDVAKACDTVVADFGRVDIVVNNAGITRDGLLMRMKEEDWNLVLAVNLKSCFNVCQGVVRHMVKARSGKIINMASVVGVMGNAGQTNYAASKAGLIGFSKSLARELASRNICVNCIAPGYIDTPMTQALNEKQKEAVLQLTPMGRFGSSQDVANAAVFLASPMADFVTGHVLAVDGGMAM